jgi:ribonucleoside-diphosphate reductase alpha chain
MDEIFESIKAAAIIQQSGGGTGFAFSRLRPKNDIVRSTGGRASGPVSFLRVFNAATEAVKQGGPSRREHGCAARIDILEFIEAKLDGGVSNFNISVGATDAFMEALAAGAEYDLVNPRDGQVTGRLSAREVFQRIVRAAWRTGDPGLVFLDRINRSRANPTPALTTIEATNPCGEQPLGPNDACNLGSINLARFVAEAPGGGSAVAWDELERVVRLAVRFLDDVIEVNPYPLPEIAATVKANRRVGLGVMGWADLLFLLDIPYDSGSALPRRAAHGLHPGRRPRSVGAARRRARALPDLRPLDLPGRPAPPERHRDDDRAHRDHLHDRGLLLGDRAPLRPRVRAPRARP